MHVINVSVTFVQMRDEIQSRTWSISLRSIDHPIVTCPQSGDSGRFVAFSNTCPRNQSHGSHCHHQSSWYPPPNSSSHVLISRSQSDPDVLLPTLRPLSSANALSLIEAPFVCGGKSPLKLYPILVDCSSRTRKYATPSFRNCQVGGYLDPLLTRHLICTEARMYHFTIRCTSR